MYMLKCLIVVACLAYSCAHPVDESADSSRVKKSADSQLPKDDKLNNTGASAGTMMAMDKMRTSNYPLSGGYGYHVVGQSVYPMPHYPTGWVSQGPYQSQLPTSIQYKMPEMENGNARTIHGLRPSLYSQYQQAAPQAYVIPAAYIQPYTYSTPYYGSSHYGGGYSSYYRDAGEEDKQRQYYDYATSDKIMSPVQPSVYYATKYLIEKPAVGMNQMPMQSNMQTMSPFLVRSQQPESGLMMNDLTEVQTRDVDGGEFKVIPATFGFQGLNDLRQRSISIDDKLQMQIPSNYLAQRLQNINPFEMNAQPQLPQTFTRAVEEPKIVENWQPAFMGQQNMAFKNSNPQPDPYITAEDQVYMEPFTMPENHQVGRSVESPVMFGYPNYRQQFRDAQLQTYYNNLNANAAQIEVLTNEAARERAMIPDSALSPKSSESLATAELFKRILQGIAHDEQKDEPKSDNKEIKKDDIKPAVIAKKIDAKSETVGNPALFSAPSNSNRQM